MTQVDDKRQLWHTPEPDAPEDALNALVEFWSGATKSLLIVDYSNNFEPQVTAIEGLLKKGISVTCILDHSQSTGKSEVPIINQLKEFETTYPDLMTLVIGESSMHHIIHDKLSVRDDKDATYGSFNYTATAAKEDNFFFIETDSPVAQDLTTIANSIKDWIMANEPQYNVKEVQS